MNPFSSENGSFCTFNVQNSFTCASVCVCWLAGLARFVQTTLQYLATKALINIYEDHNCPLIHAQIDSL